jgi:hypothetical protein
MKTYSQRLSDLKKRRTGFDPIFESVSFAEAGSRRAEKYATIREADTIKYALGMMQPIDPDYTANTIKEGDRIREQLKCGLADTGVCPEFEYQGSVTSDTHIRRFSDIDLLTIHGRFFTVEPPQKVRIAYQGNPLQDLIALRKDCVAVLKSAFPAATVDNAGSKSITVSGGSLRRKVDVVPANWYDTNDYALTGLGFYRGVMILDKDVPVRVKNQPFLHNKRIGDKDLRVGGAVRMAIRLLKTLRYDSEIKIDVSSFDIAGLIYNIPDDHLIFQPGYELNIIENVLAYLHYVLRDKAYQNSLMSVDGSRKVFGSPGTDERNVILLANEVYDLYQNVLEELNKMNRKLATARIAL